jgi:hypothetical protein
MLSKLDLFIISYILEFLDNVSCCQISSLQQFSYTNKIYKKMIDQFQKLNIIKKYPKVFDKKIAELLNKKWLCQIHSYFDSSEVYLIEKVIRNFTNFANAEKNGEIHINSYYNNVISDKYHETIHFQSSEKLNEFIRKVSNNFRCFSFGDTACCSGKGSKIYLNTVI